MDENLKEESLVYEVGYHLLPTIPEENLQAIVLKIKDSIVENGGNLISEEFPVLRPLAYEISRVTEMSREDFNRAYFGWIKFDIEKEKLVNIEKSIKNNSDILRHLLVKTVRQNTIFQSKFPNSDEKHIEKGKQEDKEKVSDEELDKSIDELLVNENES